MAGKLDEVILEAVAQQLRGTTNSTKRLCSPHCLLL